MIERYHREWDELTTAHLRGRAGYKWSPYADTDIIAAWVADMDLRAAEPIRRALIDFFDRGDLGYFDEHIFGELRELCARRMAALYGWTFEPAQVELVSDTVQSMHVMVDQLTRPGDEVAMLTPVYSHFYSSVLEQGRVPMPVPLLDTPEGYRLDLEALDRVLARPRVRMLMVCHPHNPTGRAFTGAEVDSIARAALAHGVRVVSDEVHAELVYDGRAHRPLAAVSCQAADNTVTFLAASKAFNVAGTHLGLIVYGSPGLRAALPPMPSRGHGKPGIVGCLAARAAWTAGDGWLAAAREYLQANRDYLVTRLAEQAPAVRVHRPEATYLAWLDLGAVTDDAQRFLLDRARVATSGGREFCWPRGTGGQFARLNFATGRGVLAEIVDRIVAAVR